jgi:hypothetical protein
MDLLQEDSVQNVKGYFIFLIHRMILCGQNRSMVGKYREEIGRERIDN